MAKIEGQTTVRKVEVQKPLPKPKVVAPKTEVKAKTTVKNSNTLRSDNQNYANQQKLKLNQTLKEEEKRNTGVLIGGTAGSTSGQFAQREADVRGSGKITVKNTELSYDYSKGQFVKNQNPTTPDFVSKVKTDLNKIAPGTRVYSRPQDPLGGFIWDKWHGNDTAAVVKPAPVSDRVKGHDAGYRLIDQLKNNPNEIAIHKYPTQDNAFAAPRDYKGSLGTVSNPGKGSAVDVSYNPDAVLNLSAKNPKGSLVNAPTDPAIILGHEFNHASHMQRGTNDPYKGDGGRTNTFKVDGKNFKETYQPHLTGPITLREEFRTVGTNGYGYGKEPTENRLRSELGDPNKRVAYQDTFAHQQISTTEAVTTKTKNRLQTTGEVIGDGLKGSRNSALIGGGFSAITAIAQGKDAKGVVQDAAVGAGTGVAQEVIERAVNGPRVATSGMTSSAGQAARATMKGAAVAGAVVNTAFAVHDQWDNLKNDATRSKAVGTIAGEAVVGAASGAAGAYAGAMAGAAIGSIVPGVGTVVGGVVGFAAGAAAGYLADKGLRGIGVDKVVAKGVTAVYDTASNLASGAKNLVSGAAGKLASVFGW